MTMVPETVVAESASVLESRLTVPAIASSTIETRPGTKHNMG